MEKKGVFSRERVEKSRKVFSKFYDKDLVKLERNQKEDLVRIFYEEIHGVTVSEIPLPQLSAICYKVYQASLKDVLNYGENEFEEKIIKDIGKLEKLTGFERDELAEEIAIKLEDYFVFENVSNKYRSVVEKLCPPNGGLEDVPV